MIKPIAVLAIEPAIRLILVVATLTITSAAPRPANPWTISRVSISPRVFIGAINVAKATPISNKLAAVFGNSLVLVKAFIVLTITNNDPLSVNNDLPISSIDNVDICRNALAKANKPTPSKINEAPTAITSFFGILVNATIIIVTPPAIPTMDLAICSKDKFDIVCTALINVSMA